MPEKKKNTAEEELDNDILDDEEEGENKDFLEMLRAKWLKKGKADGTIDVEDVMSDLEKFDYSDDDLDSLMTSFKEAGIKMINVDVEGEDDEAGPDESDIEAANLEAEAEEEDDIDDEYNAEKEEVAAEAGA